MNKAIYFDMDGTIADLYGVENWVHDIDSEILKPYRVAKPLVDMRKLGKILNDLQAQGWTVGIISWLSKSGTDDYNARVEETKKRWLSSHLGAVCFDEIHIVEYGMPKQAVADFPNGILFDDNRGVRQAWTGTAYDVDEILETLGALLA